MASAFVWTVLLYAAAGWLFALVFVTFGVTRVDETARGASWGFRLFILPGVAALWPLLAWRWYQACSLGLASIPVERTAHRRMAAR